MPKYTKFFEPGKMGRIEPKNRIIFTPCGTHYSTLNGLVGDRQLAYYRERAKRGVGLIMIEVASCRKVGKAGRILVNEDKFIPGLKKLADTIHKKTERKLCVLANGAVPNNALGESLKGKYLEFGEIGDCVETRRIREAVEEGIWAAVAI